MRFLNHMMTARAKAAEYTERDRAVDYLKSRAESARTNQRITQRNNLRFFPDLLSGCTRRLKSLLCPPGPALAQESAVRAERNRRIHGCEIDARRGLRPCAR